MPFSAEWATEEVEFLLHEGMPYAIWRGVFSYAWEYAEHFLDSVDGAIACMNGYDNAVKLQETIGM